MSDLLLKGLDKLQALLLQGLVLLLLVHPDQGVGLMVAVEVGVVLVEEALDEGVEMMTT